MPQRISDPVHGTIELSELEKDIISTRAFQRLHNVRQLGLAHYVFPSANYSRFAHSVGACHNAQRILAAIEKNTGEPLKEERKVAIRAAALLHDIGHYPFSHAFEHEIKEAYSSLFFSNGELSPTPTLDHEDMGALVLKKDKQLTKVFSKHGITAESILEKFSFGFDPFARILSSDLDCDRLDYLKRTAHHTGLPYGNVDINFIIAQATEVGGSFCFGTKALRAIDHMLVARYFDYIQVPFHKHVVALEWSLQVVIRELLRMGKFNCTKEGMEKAIETDRWHSFDDNEILAQARELASEKIKQPNLNTSEHGIFKHLEAILYRQPAILVGAYERVGNEDSGLIYNKILKATKAFVAKHKLCEYAIFVWKPKEVSLIKAATGATEASVLEGELSEEEWQEFVHVAISEGPTPIPRIKEALMSEIYRFRYRAIRVYAMARDNNRFLDILRGELQPKLQSLQMRVPQI